MKFSNKMKMTDKNKTSRHPHIDYNILAIATILLLLSCIVVYSVNFQKSFVREFYNIIQHEDVKNYSYNNVAIAAQTIKYHLKYILVGIVLAVFAYYFMNFKMYYKSITIKVAYFISYAMVCLVPIIGIDVNGQKRWLKLGIIFQPSEFYKILLILFVSIYLYKANKIERSNPMYWIKFAICVLPPVMAVAITDLSTSIVLFGIIFVEVILILDKPFKFLVSSVTSIILMGAIFIGTRGYRTKRIEGWINLETSDNALQTRQGLFAIASGGLTGKGIGNSIMKGSVPESGNDFVFTIICEEFGIIGAILIILLFALLIRQICSLCMHTKNVFNYLVLVGCIIHIASQIIINISVTLNLIPNTGIGLPFLSTGGSSIVVFLVELGIILSISKSISKERMNNEAKN